MSLSAAIEEAYASGDEFGVTLTTCEITHPGLDEPLYCVTGFDAPGEAGDAVLYLPLEEGGPPVLHQLIGFTFVRGGADADGPTDGKVSIDNVSGMLYPHLKAMLGYSEAAKVTFRQYQVLPGHLDEVTGPDEIIEDMQLSNVSLNETTASGDLSWPDGRRQNVPTGEFAFFDRDTYPALFS